MSLILFETPRIQCRQISLADVDSLYAVYSDADAMRWVDARIWTAQLLSTRDNNHRRSR